MVARRERCCSVVSAAEVCSALVRRLRREFSESEYSREKIDKKWLVT